MTPQAVDAVRFDQDALLAELAAAGFEVRKPSEIRCGFHEDAHPSAGVYRGEDGVWRVKCHTPSCGFCGDLYDVRAKASGRTTAQVLREAHAAPGALPAGPIPFRSKAEQAPRVYPTLAALAGSLRDVAGTYRYTNPDTKVDDLIVFRVQPPGQHKRFLQASPVPGGLSLVAPPKPWPMFNRVRIAEAKRVILVEGEKCVSALTVLGVAATTTPGGAGKGSFCDLSPLDGKESVYLWPDNDAADPKTHKRTGIEHMREMGRLIESLPHPPRLYWIDPGLLSLPEKGDCVEFIRAHDEREGQALAAVEWAMEQAEPMGASGMVRGLLESTIDGTRRAIDWPWPKLAQMTKALLPGTATVICGPPGCAKSLMLLEALRFWHAHGIKVAGLELEDGRQFHLYRALIQAARNVRMMDDEWVRQNPDQVRAYMDQHRDFLDDFGRSIHEPIDAEMRLEAVGAWVEERCKAGCRIIAVDPITAAMSTETPWVDDQRFILRAKRAVEAAGASLVVVTHPRKGRKGGSDLDDLAGGTAYQRFAQTVIWLEHHSPPENMTVVRDLGGRQLVMVNRTACVRKARNGPGQGWKVALNLLPESLTFSELGPVVDEEREK